MYIYLKLIKFLLLLLFQAGSAAAAAALATTTGAVTAPLPANAASQMWTPVDLPFSDTLYDIDFDT